MRIEECPSLEGRVQEPSKRFDFQDLLGLKRRRHMHGLYLQLRPRAMACMLVDVLDRFCGEICGPSSSVQSCLESQVGDSVVCGA
jgi:hypothetical protein